MEVIVRGRICWTTSIGSSADRSATALCNVLKVPTHVSLEIVMERSKRRWLGNLGPGAGEHVNATLGCLASPATDTRHSGSPLACGSPLFEFRLPSHFFLLLSDSTAFWVGESQCKAYSTALDFQGRLESDPPGKFNIFFLGAKTTKTARERTTCSSGTVEWSTWRELQLNPRGNALF